MDIPVISDSDSLPVELVYFLLGAGHVPDVHPPAALRDGDLVASGAIIIADTTAARADGCSWMDALPSERAAVTMRTASPVLRRRLLQRNFAAVVQYPEQIVQLGAALQDAAARLETARLRLLDSTFAMGCLRFDVKARELRTPSARIQLTQAQTRALAALASAQGRVVSRRQIGLASDTSTEKGARGVDVLVASLRAKLKQSGAQCLITSVRNQGYRISGDWRETAR